MNTTMKAIELLYENGKGTLVLNQEKSIPQQQKHEVLVKIEATAVNRTDLISKSSGSLPQGNSILGVEVAGTIVNSGEYSDSLPEGTRVMGITNGGGYAEYVAMAAETAMKIPDHLSFEEAASIPEVYLTAYQTLFLLGKLKNTETVLIHAGASGVGSAAIQLVKNLTSAKIIVTATSEKKLNLCKSLGADVAIDYVKDAFEDVVAKETNGHGVDLILDFIGASYWEKNIKSIAYDGRWILIGILGGAIVEKVDLMQLLAKRISLIATLLTPRSDQYKAKLTHEFIAKTDELFDTKKIQPLIDQVFAFKDIEKAHEHMQNNKNIGKIILSSWD